MPRVSRAQTDKNRAGIEAAAARLFRAQGFQRPTVATLMSAAGLTHGGFYGHFESKDALLAIACRSAFEQAAQRWAHRVAAEPDKKAAFSALVEAYLAPASVRDMGNGCPATALAGDVARAAPEAPVRAVYSAGLQGMVGQLQALSSETDALLAREQALLQLCVMAGAQMLARASVADPIAEQLLASARHFLDSNA